MLDWWAAFSSGWSWSEPADVLGLVTVAVTAVIPVAIWLLARAQSKRDAEVQELQAASLRAQEMIVQRQRRDSLMSIVRSADDARHLTLLWNEIQEFDGSDKELLLANFRTNTSVPLPGSSGEPRLGDTLNDKAVADYLAGLERRYLEVRAGIRRYPGLLEFIVAAQQAGVTVDPEAIARLVAGPSAVTQLPSHQFYEHLVSELPGAASWLLLELRDNSSDIAGGIRLNILTGVLLGAVEIQDGRFGGSEGSRVAAVETLRSELPMPLASLLMDTTIQPLGAWADERATEPVSATVAWLIRVVGWLFDEDDHQSMRMIENLERVITSIPPESRGWGTDAKHVREGFRSMEEKYPALWEKHGDGLEGAATSIGDWG